MLTSPKFIVNLNKRSSVIVPDKIALPFFEAKQKRVLVKAFYANDFIEFHAALRKLQGNFIIYFGKRLQKELGCKSGDEIELQLFEDTSEYGVEMPEELAAVLESDFEAQAKFELLTDGKKRTILYYILRFKNIQTRIDKALIISENLKNGITNTRELIKKFN